MNITNAIDKGEKPQPAAELNAPNINISEIREMMIMCPAIMFAKRRIMRANGFVNTPNRSTSVKMGFIPAGTGGLNMCPQKCFPELNKMMTKEIHASTKVNAILPVTLAVPGIKPTKLLMRIKKKTVNR